MLRFSRRFGQPMATIAGLEASAGDAASTALLPSALGLPTEVVYLATAALTGVHQLPVFRNRVFHATPAKGT